MTTAEWEVIELLTPLVEDTELINVGDYGYGGEIVDKYEVDNAQAQAQRLVEAVPTSLLKRWLAQRVAAEAKVLYDDAMIDEAPKGGDKVSNKATRQARTQAKAARDDAKASKAHWEDKKAAAKDETSRATFQRGIDRNQAIIDANKGK